MSRVNFLKAVVKNHNSSTHHSWIALQALQHHTGKDLKISVETATTSTAGYVYGIVWVAMHLPENCLFDPLSIFTSLRPFLLITVKGYLYQLIPINRNFITDFHPNECDCTFVVLSIDAYSICQKKFNQSVVSDQSCVMKNRKSETGEETHQK